MNNFNKFTNLLTAHFPYKTHSVNSEQAEIEMTKYSTIKMWTFSNLETIRWHE
jgi:hypothetical protein